jgi:hypothetical protein
MHNTAKKPSEFSATEKRHAIFLTDEQFKTYQKSQMHIYSPQGEYLCSAGSFRTSMLNEQERAREGNQLALLECLILTSGGDLQLSEHAVVGLADTLSRARGFIGG